MKKETVTSLKMEKGVITYNSKSGWWSLPANKVRILAETTSEAEPFLDDYSLLFVVSDTFQFDASFYSEGREAFLKAFASFHGIDTLSCRLAHSTGLASNILFPPQLEGKPLLDFAPLPPDSWYSWFLQCLGQKRWKASMRPDIRQWLSRANYPAESITPASPTHQ